MIALTEQHPRSEIRTLDGRRVVLKALDGDCMLDGELHPSIRLRLSRIREIPVATVANLHGVQRIGERDVLVWEYIEGQTLEELFPALDDARRAKVREELRLVVQRMHAIGIVHGALHARNVIIDERGSVRVTHLSPLLHSDEQVDLRAVDAMFEESPGLRSLSLRSARATPRGVAQWERSDQRSSPGDREHTIHLRPGALFGAIAALITGVVITLSLLWYSAAHS